MDFEQRLRSHLTEQAGGIQVETSDPAVITDTPPRSRSAITTLATVLVVVAGAVGFWFLSSGDDGPVTEIAAGEAEDAEEANPEEETDRSEEADQGEGDGSGVGPVNLELVDITSDNSPGYGQLLADDGIYYMLSTAPGRVDLSGENLTDEQYMELFRQNTFYVYDQDNGWTTNEVGDRFISDFDVDDGVIYVVSTGSKSGAAPAYGNSTDRGETWTWSEIDNLPEIDQLTLLHNDDAVVLFASRWGFPDHQEVMQVAQDAGIEVTEFNLRDFDHNGFSYLDIDPDDRCAAIQSQILPELQSFSEWIAQAPDEEREVAENEFESMTQWMTEELQANDCPVPEDWDSVADLEGYEFPEPIRVSWDEIGFTPPESWKTWFGTFLHDGQNFTPVDNPFGDTGQVGHAYTIADELTISMWDGEGGDAEILWRTSDGENWEQEIRRYDELEEGDYYYDAFYLEPKAGDHTFRVWWDESAYEEAEAAAQTEEEWVEPSPLLQRSTGGGPFETITLADLAPDIDVGDRSLQDVRGSQYGVFLIYGPQFGPNGPTGQNLALVHSGDGVNWNMFELEGNGIDIPGPVAANQGSMLLLAHTWPSAEGERSSAKAYLVRPAG